MGKNNFDLLKRINSIIKQMKIYSSEKVFFFFFFFKHLENACRLKEMHKSQYKIIINGSSSCEAINYFLFGKKKNQSKVKLIDQTINCL